MLHQEFEWSSRHHAVGGRLRQPISTAGPALLVVLGLVPLAVCSLGCQGRDEVRVYSIPKQAEANEASTASPPEPPGEALPARMLAAMVTGGDRVWFFKMLGAPDEVAPTVNDFRSLLSSVTFNERQEPRWALPEGWTEEPGGGMRLATLRVGSRPNSPSVSVVGLPAPQDTLDNVNRWRRQLQLAPLEAAALADAIETLAAGDLRIEWVDISGVANPANPMVAPFAAAEGLPKPPASAAGPASVRPAVSVGFAYELPTGWQQQTASGMRRAYFSVVDGEKTADITVITLPASGVLDNLNRWRGELQLEPVGEAELNQHSAPLTVSGKTGTWINRMESSTEPRRATIAAMVENDSQMWFFKITGPAELVAREEQNFQNFVESVEL